MADQSKPLTTSPMYPGVEYVRVQQGDVEFTTAKTAVSDDMTVLKDADAVSAISGLPLEPTPVKKSSGGSSAKKS